MPKTWESAPDADDKITNLVTCVQRRFLPAKAAYDLHGYITAKFMSWPFGLSSEEKKTLLKIKQALAWKAKVETEGSHFQGQYAQALWAARHPEQAKEYGWKCDTPEEVLLKILTDIKEHAEKEAEVPLPDKSLLYSWMSTYFKKAPHIKAFLTPSRWALVLKIFR